MIGTRLYTGATTTGPLNCMIAVCEEMGCDDSFSVKDAAARMPEYMPSTVRRAIFTLCLEGTLQRVSHGVYRWTPLECYNVKESLN